MPSIGEETHWSDEEITLATERMTKAGYSVEQTHDTIRAWAKTGLTLTELEQNFAKFVAERVIQSLPPLVSVASLTDSWAAADGYFANGGPVRSIRTYQKRDPHAPGGYVTLPTKRPLGAVEPPTPLSKPS